MGERLAGIAIHISARVAGIAQPGEVVVSSTVKAITQRGETVLVHGAAGRVGTAVLELGALAGLRLYGTASARGEIHPVVAERLPLTEARRAHELLERSAATGKLVLVP